MPSEWNEASLENVDVADNSISVFYTKTDKTITYKIIQSNPEWNIQVDLPKADYIVSDENISRIEKKGRIQLISNNKILEVRKEK